MNPLLIPAVIFALTTLSFAVQAAYWRRQAKASEHAAMQMGCDLARVARDSYASGFAQGGKTVAGGMYLAAMRVDASEPILVALRAAGRQLLGEPPQSVTSSLETETVE